jgi:hypothetical protein
MKVLSVLLFAGGIAFLALTFRLVLTRGWGPLDVELFHVYFVVVPHYLLLTAVVFLVAGCVSVFAPHP